MSLDSFNSFFDSYDKTMALINKLTWALPELLGGVALLIVTIIVARVVVRAFLGSVIGRPAASIWSGVVEIIIAVLLSLKTAENPAVLLVAVGWSAAVFRSLVAGNLW